MKRISVVILLFIIASNGFTANINDSLSLKLKKVMNNKEYYIAEKEQRINSIKQMLSLDQLTPEQNYNLNYKIYEEYKKYKTDSAVYYLQKNLDIAEKLGKQDLRDETNIQLVWLYSSKGMYIEAKTILDNINQNKLSKDLLSKYYDSYTSFYSHYGQSNNDDNYYRESEVYRDSLLSLLDTTSLRYNIVYAAKELYAGNAAEAEQLLLKLLDKTSDKDIDRGLIAYLLGHMYKGKKNIELQKKYFTISAITDIENCIKDNASMQSLALTYHETGDIDNAFVFMKAAIDDAVFCNVRYRTMEGSAFYPIINASYQEKEAKSKSQLQLFLILISILSIFLILLVLYVYKQMKRLSQIRKELYRANQQMSELISNLHNANSDLQEANHIKEEYIAHFFNLCSTYINKLEDYRKSLNKKAANRQMDELFKMLKSNTIVEDEVAELYLNFDTIFLKIYPSFVDDFNKLLVPEEQIQLKQGELLNTELRIFALIRLGITDNDKIANFLRYSLRTVYNYQTKVRNKLAISRDDFEEMIKKIGTFRKKSE